MPSFQAFLCLQTLSLSDLWLINSLGLLLEAIASFPRYIGDNIYHQSCSNFVLVRVLNNFTFQFMCHGNSIYNIIPLLKKENVYLF